MDLDGDGNLDLLAGSFEPGELYLFRGQGRGTFKARETVVDKEGNSVGFIGNPSDRFGIWADAVDWNDDGLPDLIMGRVDGRVMVRLNEGTRGEPRFAATNIEVLAEGKELVVPGGQAVPAIADWDGDGKWDLIFGSANGAVWWYRNVGDPGRPRFAAPIALVQPTQVGSSELLAEGEEPRPGGQATIAVGDWNGDGKLDLLLGDARRSLEPIGLNSEERRKFSEIHARRCAIGKETIAALKKMGDDVKRYEEELSAQGLDKAELRQKVGAQYIKLRDGNRMLNGLQQQETELRAEFDRIGLRADTCQKLDDLEKRWDEISAKMKELTAGDPVLRELSKEQQELTRKWKEVELRHRYQEHGYVWVFPRN